MAHRPTSGLETRLRAAQDAASRGDLERAARVLEEALRLAPGHAGASHLLGTVELARGRAAEAVRHLERAAAVDAAALVHLGVALAALGRTEEAEETLRRAAAARRDDPQAAYNLGHLLAGLGRRDEAETELRRAIALAPGYLRARCELAGLCYEDDRLDEAEAVLAPAQPTSEPLVLYHLALIDRRRGRWAEAAERFALCRASMPGERDLLLGLGSCLQELGRLEEALEVYRDLLRRDPKAYGEVLRSLASASKGCFDLRPAAIRALLGLA